jgi:hypothetical protein
MEDDFYKFMKKRHYLKYDINIIRYIYNNEDIPFELWSKQRYPRSVNIYCKIKCISCKKESRVSTKHLAKRTLIKEEICCECGKYEFYNRVEWLTSNSESQKKIQSTAAQKLKNSNAVKKFWEENPEKKEQVRQKILSYYRDPEYKKMVASKQKQRVVGLSGKYYFRNKYWVLFESSYELCFLAWLELKEEYSKVERCNLYINYIYEDSNRTYNPDFIIYINEQKIIVEIKSKKTYFFNNSKNIEKINATNKFINQDNEYKEYWFIDEIEAEKINLVFKRSRGISSMCKQLFKQSKLQFLSENIKNRYVGK